mmetsp:Transcript_124775/g.388416  ORF Transcript_124775/g.388416 Transcript_124775/m.388416 type:complete len:674 (-) Transcript_124775:93-2114(-)
MEKQAEKYAWEATGGKDALPESAKTDAASQKRRAQGSAPCVAAVDSDEFDIAMGLLVLVNVVLLSVETDTVGSIDIWKRINEGFLLIYLLELVLRFLRHGSDILHDRLNILDFFLVVFAFIDRIASERGLARSLPVFRLARVFRVLRTSHYFKNGRELNVLVENSSKAMSTLGWVMLILCAVLGASAAWTKIVIGESPVWNGSMNPLVSLEPFAAFDRNEYFGSVPRSLLTLLQVLTLSQWADNVARPIGKAYPVTLLFFFTFLLILSYGLLMCIVSVIVQDAITSSRRVADALGAVEREERKRTAHRAMKIFALVDADGNGELSSDELRVVLETTDLAKILKELDVPVLDADSLVRLFDKDGDGAVNQEEFVTGIMSMSDNVQPRDFVKLNIWVWNLMMKTQTLEGKLERLHEKVINLKHKLEIGFTAMHRFMNTHEDTSLRHKAVLAIRSAPPELPLSTSSDRLVAPAEDEDDAADQDPTFAKISLPNSPCWVKALPKRPRAPTRWVTVVSPFVVMRDRAHISANHIGALKPGEQIEFEDIAGEPVVPDQLPDYQFLRCWKMDSKGEKGSSGYVVAYSPSHGAHFVPADDPFASRYLADKAPPPASRLDSASSEDRAIRALVNRRGVLPPAPPPLHIQKQEAEVAVEPEDKYGLRGPVTNPNFTNLKEIIS